MSGNKAISLSPNVAKFECNNKVVIVNFFECETFENGEPDENNIKQHIKLSFDSNSFGSLSEAFLSTSAMIDRLLESGDNND